MKFEWGVLLALSMVGHSAQLPLSLATPFKLPEEIRQDTFTHIVKNFDRLDMSRVDLQGKIFLGKYFKNMGDLAKSHQFALEVLETPDLKVEEYLNAIDLILYAGGDHGKISVFLTVFLEEPRISALEKWYIAEQFAQINRLDKTIEILKELSTPFYDHKALSVLDRISILKTLASSPQNYIFVEETAEKIMKSPNFLQIYKIDIARILLGINPEKSIEMLHEIANDPKISDKIKFHSKTILSLFDAKNNTVNIHGFLP